MLTMADESCLYTLPTICFVGGETQNLRFHMYRVKTETPFNVSGCTASFAVAYYQYRLDGPILTKDMTIDETELEYGNVFAVDLEPSDTVDLSGKFIYQITVKDQDGEVEIPKQGILYVIDNIHKAFIDE